MDKENVIWFYLYIYKWHNEGHVLHCVWIRSNTGHAHDAGMYVKQHDQSRSTSMNSVEIFGQIQNVRIYIWISFVIG